MNTPRRGVARETWWAVAAGASLLAASQWLHAPSVEYLIPWLLATAAAALLVTRMADAQQRWAAACVASLAIAVGLAAPAERNLWRVNHDWDAWRREAAADALHQLRGALDDAAQRSIRRAELALDAPADRPGAFDHLDGLVGGPDENGVVLYRRDVAVAWAGTVRVPVDEALDGVGVLASAFYLELHATLHRGTARSTAVVLLDAIPPAQHLASSLAARIAEDEGIEGFTFTPAADSTPADALRYQLGGQALFDVRPVPLVQGEVALGITERVRGRAGVAFLVALACFIIAVWRQTRRISQRIAALAVGLACTALVPLSQYSNLTRLFDPSVYFTSTGGPLTGNAGALGTTSALVLLGILGVYRRRWQRISRWGAAATVLLVAGLGPFLLRELARGVQMPATGVNSELWLIWEIPLFLAAVCVLLAGAGAGAIVLGRSRGLPPFVAPAVAALAALLAPIVWEAPGQWPWWYTFVWIAAIAMLALSRQTRYVILSAATVAALGATTLVWGRSARGRVVLAERDLAGLSQVDSTALELARRFGGSLSDDVSPTTRLELLQRYVVSDLAHAPNPAAVSAWPTDSGPTASFATASIPEPRAAVRAVVARARATRAVTTETVASDTAVEIVMAAPGSDGGVTAVVIAPKSRLFDTDPFARLLGLDFGDAGEPPYTVRLREPVSPALARNGAARWRRGGSQLHGDWVVRTGTGAAPAHVEVELRPPYALVQRGVLIVLLDLLIVGALWFVSVTADGGAGRWLRARQRTWGRSYRARLSLALFAFFVIPAAAFAVWSYGQLASDATQSRALLVRETLRALAAPPADPAALAGESDRLDTPLFLYHRGELHDASDTLYTALAPIGYFLDPDVEVAVAVRDEETVTQLERVDGTDALFGFRAFEAGQPTPYVVAAPARADEMALGRRRRDLGVLVLFATAVGALAALWLSGIAARQLARPIRTLREAALAIASGDRTPPLEAEPTVEFYPVFAAFRRMAADLNASRTELEQAQRRTAAVLRNVASGVIALDNSGVVVLANPRAESLLARSLSAGTIFAAVAPPSVAELVARFLASDSEDEDFEMEVGQEQWRGRLTRLARGGAVVTLDDVTELARAQRVLAWGEMARQVAHEIKNPLTPIRLGVQHLRRARADSRVDFDRVLERNVNQILSEIDRLDEIARNFSRYGSGPDERPPARPTDVAAVVSEVVSLEQMGGDQRVSWHLAGADAPALALARADELKEVLINVLENARLAGAQNVRVSVRRGDDGYVTITAQDDGHGIPADVMPRIFEPHFSTRTSGSGLGLAISRQIVDGWGGDIAVESRPTEGATVTIRLRGV
ncbi:MAG TPA: ATP-binding protein [Gemmatimonadaceae bacterium]